jgi:hypothetical protein
LLCVEEKLSLVQRYRLKELLTTVETRKRVKHFDHFINQLTDCSVDTPQKYKEIIEKISR